MAVDKLVDSTQLDADLTSVANAIRSAGGASSSLTFPAGFVTAIGNIGSQLPASLLHYEEFTPTTTLTNNNQMTFDLVADVDSIIIVSINDYPSTPDPTNYIAICWTGGILGGSNGVGGTGQILRPNGTVGSDVAMCNFTRSSGRLLVGGQYGYFLAGTTYSIYQIGL